MESRNVPRLIDALSAASTTSKDHPANPLALRAVRRSEAWSGQTHMTRAVNIDAAMDHVIATSAKLNAVISAIEPLVPSGTRVVFVNADHAATVTRAYGSKVLTGVVTRSQWAQQRVS